MTRSVQELRETLEELHRQLESTTAVDSELSEPLQRVMGDIREVLDSGGELGGATHRTLADRLSDLALEFEGSHPTLAGTINQLTHVLSNLGI